MKKDIKTRQIVVRFDGPSYDRINEYANFEHRGLGEFVRHAVLVYIDKNDFWEQMIEQKHRS